MSNQTRLPRLINVNGVPSIRSNDLAQAFHLPNEQVEAIIEDLLYNEAKNGYLGYYFPIKIRNEQGQKKTAYMLAQPLFCKIAESFQSEHLTKVKKAYAKAFTRMTKRINSLELQYAC